MNWIGPRSPESGSPDAYQQLRQHVLKRDGWRCQNCGSMRNLEVHHMQLRSELGDDVHDNLITLCSSCHKASTSCNRRAWQVAMWLSHHTSQAVVGSSLEPGGEYSTQRLDYPSGYRGPSRRGSVNIRKNHSRPIPIIQRGAWGFTPAWKSKAAPTPIRTGAVTFPV